MGSLDLGVPFVSTNQASPEIVVNTAIDSLDRATQHQSSIAMSNADYTLTAAQFVGCAFVIMTGALTGDKNVIVPIQNADGNTLQHLFVASNATSGGHNLTFKTAAGTGIALAASDGPCLLFADGTNVVALKTI